MRRRDFIAGLASTAWPLSATAKMPPRYMAATESFRGAPNSINDKLNDPAFRTANNNGLGEQ
jgi:hypothetical protein